MLSWVVVICLLRLVICFWNLVVWVVWVWVLSVLVFWVDLVVLMFAVDLSVCVDRLFWMFVISFVLFEFGCYLLSYCVCISLNFEFDVALLLL